MHHCVIETWSRILQKSSEATQAPGVLRTGHSQPVYRGTFRAREGSRRRRGLRGCTRAHSVGHEASDVRPQKPGKAFMGETWNCSPLGYGLRNGRAKGTLSPRNCWLYAFPQKILRALLPTAALSRVRRAHINDLKDRIPVFTFLVLCSKLDSALDYKCHHEAFERHTVFW